MAPQFRAIWGGLLHRTSKQIGRSKRIWEERGESRGAHRRLEYEGRWWQGRMRRRWGWEPWRRWRTGTSFAFASRDQRTASLFSLVWLPPSVSHVRRTCFREPGGIFLIIIKRIFILFLNLFGYIFEICWPWYIPFNYCIYICVYIVYIIHLKKNEEIFNIW